MSVIHPVFGSFTRPQIIGSINSIEQLPEFSQLGEHCDIVEFRLDQLVMESSKAVQAAIESTANVIPVLITARCKAEGSEYDLSSEQRASLLKKFSSHASLFDTEIASAEAMQHSIQELKQQGLQLVLSAHDFQSTPAPSILREKIQLAHKYGADIAKFAVFHNSLADLHSAAHLMQDCFSTPVAMMGMGDLAPVSRVLFAQLGSVLNYGYLGDTPTAPGQWPAKLLKEAILSTKSLV